MDLTQAFILALIQGVTEFLPISSTAHLILVPELTDWPDQGLAFDVALNTATWLAVVLYFKSDIYGLARGLFRSIREGGLKGNAEGRLAWMMLAATVPVGAAGLAFHDYAAGVLRSYRVVAWSSIIWGVVLYIADRRPGDGDVNSINWKGAAFVGMAQAIAIVPGTSRSGITMTAGLFAGLSRTAAARFSFLLAVAVGALAGGKEGVELVKAGAETPWLAVSVGFAVAFTSAYLTIHYFLRFITRSSMTPFVIYRVLLGIALLALV